ncbi:hypothetical protein YC2023_106524 [Brassica napus]
MLDTCDSIDEGELKTRSPIHHPIGCDPLLVLICEKEVPRHMQALLQKKTYFY